MSGQTETSRFIFECPSQCEVKFFWFPYDFDAKPCASSFLHVHSCTLQPNYALDACISGCGIFSTIEYERGNLKPLDNLKNCNYSKYILLFNICALVLF